MTEALKYVLCLGLLLATTRGSVAAAAALFTEEVLLKPRQEYTIVNVITLQVTAKVNDVRTFSFVASIFCGYFA